MRSKTWKKVNNNRGYFRIEKVRHDMKKMILTAAVLGFAATFSLPAGAQVKTGETAPAFSLPDTSGNTQSLEAAKGKFIVLEWINHDCPFVMKHYGSGNMQNLQAELTGKGVVWYSIASSAEGKQGHYDAAKWNELSAEKGSKASAVLLDPNGEVGKAYGAQTTPHMFLINPEGKIVYQGAIDSNPSPDPKDISGSTNYVRQAFEQASSGQEVSAPSTKAYGCSVKY
jgi:peroxiredoxin